MLLNLEQSWKVKELYPKPIMIPKEDYEIKGFRGNAIFPGSILFESDGEVKIYYGAADTTVCLATTDKDELLNLFSDSDKK